MIGITVADDLGRAFDQLAVDRLFLDDLGVVFARWPRAGRSSTISVKRVVAADLLELAAMLQLVGEGDRVDPFVLVVEVADRRVDDLVGIAVEILRRAGTMTTSWSTSLSSRMLPEHAALGLEVLRRKPVAAMTAACHSVPGRWSWRFRFRGLPFAPGMIRRAPWQRDEIRCAVASLRCVIAPLHVRDARVPRRCPQSRIGPTRIDLNDRIVRNQRRRCAGIEAVQAMNWLIAAADPKGGDPGSQNIRRHQSSDPAANDRAGRSTWLSGPRSDGRFLGVGRHDPELHFALDVLGEVDLDRVEAQLFERAFDPDVLGLDREVLVPERFGDLIGVDRAVEVSLGVGVGLDRERALGDLGGQVQEIGRRASSSSLSRWRCFSTIRRLFWVANVARPWGTR